MTVVLLQNLVQLRRPRYSRDRVTHPLRRLCVTLLVCIYFGEGWCYFEIFYDCFIGGGGHPRGRKVALLVAQRMVKDLNVYC